MGERKKRQSIFWRVLAIPGRIILLGTCIALINHMFLILSSHKQLWTTLFGARQSPSYPTTPSFSSPAPAAAADDDAYIVAVPSPAKHNQPTLSQSLLSSASPSVNRSVTSTSWAPPPFSYDTHDDVAVQMALEQFFSEPVNNRGCPLGDLNLTRLDTLWLSRTNRTLVRRHLDATPDTMMTVLPLPHMDMSKHTDPKSPSVGAIYLFKRAFVGGKGICVFDCNVAYAQGGCAKPQLCDLPLIVSAHRPPQLVSKALLLSQTNVNDVYHGLMESFMRIAFFPSRLLHNPSVTILLRLPTNYMFLLDLFNVDRIRVKVPTKIQCAYSNRAAVNKVYKTIEARLGGMFPLFPAWRREHAKVCIIKRTPGHQRSIDNHDEMVARLIAAFPTLEFMVYNSWDSTEDIIRVFASSQYIIGPHGAGWVNVLFARQDAQVLEIFPKGWTPGWEMCHRVYIQQLGLGYTSLVADAINKKHVMNVHIPDVVVILAKMTGLLPTISVA